MFLLLINYSSTPLESITHTAIEKCLLIIGRGLTSFLGLRVKTRVTRHLYRLADAELSRWRST